MDNTNVENIKFKWESMDEYQYRKEIHEISLEGGAIMKIIAENKSPKNNRIYITALNRLTISYNKLKSIKVPFLYLKTNEYLHETYDYYLRAFKILIEEYGHMDKINLNKINKAATFISAGNSFINIISCKNFESFENQQQLYNKNKNKNKYKDKN